MVIVSSLSVQCDNNILEVSLCKLQNTYSFKGNDIATLFAYLNSDSSYDLQNINVVLFAGEAA